MGRRVTFSKEARDKFLAFALSPTAHWSGNLRDLNAGVARMATLAPGGRIAPTSWKKEIKRLLASWSSPDESPPPSALQEILDKRQLEEDKRQLEELDLFDRAQLGFVVDVRSVATRCRKQAVPCSAPLARERPSQMMRIGSASIWHASGLSSLNFAHTLEICRVDAAPKLHARSLGYGDE